MSDLGPPSERFLCAPALRIESHERVSDLKFAQLEAHLSRIEEMMERIEKRLWLAVFGVVAVILSRAVQSLMVALP
jgi:hypothetical protein